MQYYAYVTLLLFRSWAKRTGFVSTFSSETNTNASERFDSTGFDLERGVDHRGGGSSSPKIEIDPVVGRTKQNGRAEIGPVQGNRNKNENNVMLDTGVGALRSEKQRGVVDKSSLRDRKEETRGGLNGNINVNGNGIDAKVKPSAIGTEGGDGGSGMGRGPGSEPKKDGENIEGSPEINRNNPGGEEPSPDPGWWSRRLELRCGLRDKPGPGQ